MNATQKKTAQELLSFINQAPTMFHAAQSLVVMLEKAGFTALDEAAPWKLEKGKGYFVVRNNSAVIAFRTGKKSCADAGFRLAGAHTDSPMLKLKWEAETTVRNMVKVPVEVYGGPIIATWLDRELSIAGRVLVKTTSGFTTMLADIKKPCAIIPNLAIHLNREINKGFEYNNQSHLPALLSALPAGSKKEVLKTMIAEHLGIDVSAIAAMDLFLYDAQHGTLAGSDAELIVSGRIDNLAMCHAIAAALCSAKPADATQVAMFYDNEEVGNTTYHGAHSSFTRDLLDRIVLAGSSKHEDLYRAAAKSWMISADAAHALHPNFAEKHDPAYAPLINCGPAIKMSATFRYATTAESAAYFAGLCEKAKVPCQKITNRSDIPSGTTIGPETSSQLSIKTVDVGNPMFAMHSIRETAGALDHTYMIEALKQHFIF